MSKYVLIMQGAPGSGKTTIAQNLAFAFGAHLCSADDFRLDEEGRYVFAIEDTARVHAACQEKARNLLSRGMSIIVDNTNVRAWEARPTSRWPWRRMLPSSSSAARAVSTTSTACRPNEPSR